MTATHAGLNIIVQKALENHQIIILILYHRYLDFFTIVFSGDGPN